MGITSKNLSADPGNDGVTCYLFFARLQLRSSFQKLRSLTWARTAEKGTLHFKIHSSEGIVTRNKN